MADDKKKPIKLNDEQLMLDASQVADIYHQLTIDLFDQVIDRLKERGSTSLDDNPYIWQLEKMNEMGLLNEDNLQLITERSSIAEEQLRYVIQNDGYKIYKNTKQQLLEATGGGDFVANSLIQTNLAAYVNQTMGDINNLINTTLPKSVMGAYQSIIEEATAKVVTGLATSDKAISDTVMKWAKKGFYGFTDSQGKHWRADTYARQVIKSTAWRVYREVRMAPAEELGIDTFYYSKKATAREMCAPLQHRIVTTGQARIEKGERILALSDYGYGSAGGCLGINCTHEITPFVVGANYKPELSDDVKDLTPEQTIENANVQAKQRALERSIRQSKEFLHVSEKLGDTDLIDKYKSKIRIQQGAMRDYLKQNPFLHRDYAREKYYDNPYSKAKKEIKLRAEHEKLNDFRSKKALLDKAVNSGKIVTVNGITVGHTPPGRVGKPDSIIQHNATNGDILGRTYYDARGIKSKEVHFTNHKQPKNHPYGNRDEHSHDYIFDDNGKFISRNVRDLTEKEREENLDVLWRY
ncbi:phage minor capsid 2 family protein [Streptococcus porcinus]|uniref:phage minor capsid protein n=1 Tax=Streptococcus porcinus TaxID=1340 RepID=UPI0010CAC4A8|nr:phage minor capsid protein [Streptococcus porcinus]VTS32882.1 phage minor capsid 2 family protein [Streptococcus porcinus]